ncbi:hypothetical protein R1sor_016419 [Riccia sorocarpa]|uniref:Germin-like protein n=1 Tax=Riccia sorocarpa TaxID=122646 RepID=A0ABD3HJ17_9MARC
MSYERTVLDTKNSISCGEPIRGLSDDLRKTASKLARLQRKQAKFRLEVRGIDPRAYRMQSDRSTICQDADSVNPPCNLRNRGLQSNHPHRLRSHKHTYGRELHNQGLRAQCPPYGSHIWRFGLGLQFVAQFPGVTDLGISSLFFKLGTGGIVPPHFHARATELFLVLSGTFHVGFLDSANVLYSATLQAGDQFVFPQGLVHYQQAGSSSAT